MGEVIPDKHIEGFLIWEVFERSEGLKQERSSEWNTGELLCLASLLFQSVSCFLFNFNLNREELLKELFKGRES